MRIIHCADIHLGSKLESNFSGLKAKERKAELFDNFVRLIEYAKDNEIYHVIIAGDLFDFVKGNTQLVIRTLKVIEKYQEISFYYLQGNHDEEILKGAKMPKNLLMFGKTFKRFDIDESISIGGMEDINPDDVYFSRGRINILVLHGNVVVGKPVNKEDVNLSYFKNKNINYIALGHIHKKIDYKVDETLKASYSGCLEGRGFDELGIKGFYVLDVDHDVKQTFVTFSKRVCHEILVDITGTVDYIDICSRISESLIECKPVDIVRVVLTGEYDVNLDKNIDMINNKFTSNYYLFDIKDNSKLKIDYKDYEDEVSILGEFVRTVLKDDTIENKDDVLMIGIKALRREDF